MKKAPWFAGFFLFCVVAAFGQSKTSTDSLEQVYASGNYRAQDKLKILKELAVNHTDTERKLFFSDELIRGADALDSVDYLFQGLLEKGTALRLKSDLSNALESYFQAAKIADDNHLNRRLGTVYVAMADVYSIMGNQDNAARYYQNGIRILKAEKDSVLVASALLNAGDMYTNTGKLDSALQYTREAETLFTKLNYPAGKAYSLGNMGMIYAKLGNNARAEEYMNGAILIMQELREFYPIAVYLTYISDIYLDKGDESTALSYALRSLSLAQKYGLRKEVGDAFQKISVIYEKLGMPGESFKYYKKHIAYKDSVSNITSVQQMADLRTDFEVSRKQIEVDLLNQQKRTQQIIVVATTVGFFLICLLAFGIFRRYRFIRETNQIIEQERSRSESLLLNILPRETAQELKQNGKVLAKKFDSVTVLFADFTGFTSYAERLSPEQLVESVDHYFSKFDEIMDRHGLEKIKTLGDAYMCAGGLPFPTADHAYRMVLAAFEMADFVSKAQKSHSPGLAIRIGINSGPVVAGVVGTKKFAYDIWGDTVNIASRMETSSEPGRINVSENTYELIKNRCHCEYRGEIEVKNKGMMKMYFVDGIR